jgi:hypothetical protein
VTSHLFDHRHTDALLGCCYVVGLLLCRHGDEKECPVCRAHLHSRRATKPVSETQPSLSSGCQHTSATSQQSATNHSCKQASLLLQQACAAHLPQQTACVKAADRFSRKGRGSHSTTHSQFSATNTPPQEAITPPIAEDGAGWGGLHPAIEPQQELHPAIEPQQVSSKVYPQNVVEHISCVVVLCAGPCL